MPDTSWTVDSGNNTFTIDGVSIDGGWPDFTVGDTTELIFVFDKSNHLSRYEEVKQRYAQYLSDKIFEVGIDYQRTPYFSDFGHRDDPNNAVLLWELTPSTDIDGVESWWIFVTDINDETDIPGTGEKLSIEAFVVARGDEGNRTVINNRYRV